MKGSKNKSKANLQIAHMGQFILINPRVTTLIIVATLVLGFYGVPCLFVAFLCTSLLMLDDQSNKATLPVSAFLLTPIAFHLVMFDGNFIFAPLIEFPVLILMIYLYKRLQAPIMALEITGMVLIFLTICVHALYPQYHDAWSEHMLIQINKMHASAPAQQQQLEMIKTTLKTILPYALGLRCASVLIFSTIYCGLACFWHAHIHNKTIACTKLWHNMTVSHLSLMFFVSILAFSLLGIDTTSDMLIILVIVLSFSGLSLIHYFAYNHRHKKIILISTYTCLLFLSLYSACALVIAAITDSILGLRRHIDSLKIN
jgi:hypothetical protein